MSKILKYALDYARHGWHVLPLNPREKTPVGRLVPQGVKNATTDERTIKNWFHKTNFNLGIATGPKSKIWVLDIDGTVGAVVWWDWEAVNGSVFTLAQRTGRIDGGKQLFFQWPQDRPVQSKTKFLPGLDSRGRGGYVVAPPSIHPSGKPYVWEGKVPINPAPDKLLDLVSTKRHPTTERYKNPIVNNSDGSNYGKVAINELFNELASCARGERDKTGYRVAVRLLELEKTGAIEPGKAEEVLRAGLARCGYLDDPRKERGEKGFQRILNSARKRIH